MFESVSRRAVVGGAAATAVVVPVAVTFTGQPTGSTGAPVTVSTSLPTTSLGAYLQIDTSDQVTLAIGSTEMGQGIMTGMAQLVAEELMLSWSQIKVVHAPASTAKPNPYANPLFHAQVTGGSTSMRGWYLPMRQAAAIAGQMLLTAAAKLTPGGTWTFAPGGKVTNGLKTYLFSDLVATAANVPVPTSAPLATTSNFIGKRIARTDIPAKVDGSAVFGIDVQVTGMVFASVVHSPILGGTVATMPKTSNGALALVNLGNAVGVVATNTWSAMNIANGLASKVTWTPPASTATRDSASILAVGDALLTSTSATAYVYETTGSVDPAAVIPGSHAKIDATYHLPYLAHACMEVLNCTAVVTSTACEVWAPTQGQQFCIPTIQAITGLAPEAITVHTTYLGGGLGRKIDQDYIAQAVTIAKAVGKPVKLTWSRKQDFQNDKFRPCAAIRVQAGLDSVNNFTGMVYRNVSPSISVQRGGPQTGNPEDTGAVAGALALPYAIPNRRIEFVPNPADIPLGYWRSVGESYNTFAVESAIDELAKAAGVDPMAFRKAQLAGNARALGVLNAVDTLSGWSAGPAPKNNARGVAFLSGFGSYIALVAQISVNSTGQIQVNKMFCAIDCGLAVNPNLIEAQVQGGIAHGLSAALWGQVTFAAGAPNVVNFSNYRVLRLKEMPPVAITIVASTAAPGGVGDTGGPCVAPALSNAYDKLTNNRVRTLPFYPGATMSDG